MAYQPTRLRRRRRRRNLWRLPAAVLLLTMVLTGGRYLLTARVSAQPVSDVLAAQEVQTQPRLPQRRLPEESPAPAEEGQPSSQEEAAPAEEGQPDRAEPVPEGETVGEDWFDDAAFVGDSLTDGLLLYSGIRGADNLAYKGLTVLSAATDAVIRSDGEKYTPVEALGRKAYGKVYLLLGINELGWYNDQRFYDCYAQLVDQVRAAQPDAQIYLQTLLPVTAEKSRTHQWLKNEKIAVYNDLIAQLAAEKGVFLLDSHAALADENGVLPAEQSTDGVHLTKSGYQVWADYLRTHAVTPDETP